MAMPLADRIARWIQSLPPRERFRLSLAQEGSGLRIHGAVSSLALRHAIEQGCTRAPGEPMVMLDVSVRPEPEDAVADVELARRVQASLQWNAWLRDLSLAVTVDGGRVRLSGEVATREQALAARALIESLHGVVEYHDDLASGVSPLRADLVARVREGLRAAGDVDSARVRIECRDGRIVLEGEIGDWSERRRIVDVARAVAGVTVVEDRLLTDD